MKRFILIVDDDEGIRRPLRAGLTALGHTVFLAHDHASALYAAREHTLDWGIVDQNLTGDRGDRSGLHLTDELLEANDRMRIVIHTGYGTVDAAFSAGRRDRIVGYLEKPATVEEICAKLEGRSLTPRSRPATIERVTRAHILRVLADHDGNQTLAAIALGISRDTLRRKLE